MAPAHRTALVIFPALALAFSAGCASADTALPPGTGTDSPSSAAPVVPSVSAVSVTSTGQVRSTSSVSKSGAAAALALDVLSGITVKKEQNAGYARSKFRHWTDADSDSCNTREEVLIAESTSTAQVSYPGCKVIEGDWVSMYDGLAVTDPAELDIDHFVPLKEAWGSGAHAWTAQKRQQFANDLSDARALVAVTASTNRSKGEKDPPQWMPPDTSIACSYLSDWVAVKSHWKLSMDDSEFRYIQKRLSGACAGTTLAPWGVADSSVRAAPGSPTGAPSAPVTTAVPTQDTAPAAKGSLPTIKPGAYCTPVGANGTYGGVVYLCSRTKTDGTPYVDGRARWRRV